MTYTKGPWTIKQGKIKSDGSRACHVSGLGWDKFAKVWVRTTDTIEKDNDDEDGIANLNLIAAAPELLEALEGMVRMSEASGNSDRIIHELSLRAIAKARGEA